MGRLDASGVRAPLRRSRWAAIGAAVAVSLGAGGLFITHAAPGVPSSTVTIDPVRILDTRDPNNVGLNGPFVSAVGQDLQVTGSIPTATGTQTVVPDFATGVIMNVTVINPTADGFISVRPADATGAPTTSNLNFKAGETVPNAVTVRLPFSGADMGKIEITYDALGIPGPTAEVLVDVVGYLQNLPITVQSGVEYSQSSGAIEMGANQQVIVVGSIEVFAALPGHVIVTASAWTNQVAGVSLRCQISTSSTTFGGDQTASQFVSSNAQSSIAITRGFSVAGGSTVFYFLCKRDDNLGAGTLEVVDRNMTAIYSPSRV